MWLMTKQGFFSVVQHRDYPEDVLVRARCIDDIENFLHVAGIAHGFEWTPTADYPYRTQCPKPVLIDALARMANDIDYDNFKNAIKADGQILHASAYAGVWGEMLMIDDRERVLPYSDG